VDGCRLTAIHHEYVTWLEIILVGTILAASLAATTIARNAVEKARADEAPEEKTFLAQQQIERQEQLLARQRAELDRVHEKLIDARATMPLPAALVAHLEQYLARADASVRAAETDLAKRRKVATAAFKKAKHNYDWHTRVIALRCAGRVRHPALPAHMAIASLPHVKSRLRVHRGLLIGAVLLSIPLLAVYELFQEAGVVLAAAILLFALVIIIAGAMPEREEGKG